MLSKKRGKMNDYHLLKHEKHGNPGSKKPRKGSGDEGSFEEQRDSDDRTKISLKKINYAAFVFVMSVLIVVVTVLAICGAVALGYVNSMKSSLLVHRFCVVMTNDQVFDTVPNGK